MDLIEDLKAEHGISQESFDKIRTAVYFVVREFGAETVKAVAELVEDQLAE